MPAPCPPRAACLPPDVALVSLEWLVARFMPDPHLCLHLCLQSRSLAKAKVLRLWTGLVLEPNRVSHADIWRSSQKQ